MTNSLDLLACRTAWPHLHLSLPVPYSPAPLHPALQSAAPHSHILRSLPLGSSSSGLGRQTSTGALGTSSDTRDLSRDPWPGAWEGAGVAGAHTSSRALVFGDEAQQTEDGGVGGRDEQQARSHSVLQQLRQLIAQSEH